MVSVLDYTRKLLYEHDCVVLPDLGGFLAYFSHAFYSQQNELYHAPQKKVAFNEALKLDDGLLVHYMTINEQISREEAQKRVRQFVSLIKTTVQQQGECFLEGIGTLSANMEGKMQFEPLPTSNFYQDGYGFKSVAVSSLAEYSVKNEEPVAAVMLTDREPVAIEVAVPRRRKTRIVAYAIGGILVLGIGIVASLTQFSSESLKSSLNPFEIASTLKVVLSSDKENNTVKEKIQVAENKVDVPVVAATAITSLPTENLTATPAETKPVEAAKIDGNGSASTQKVFESDSRKNYFVMAGGFSNIKNAQRLTKKLRRNGYIDAYIMNPTPEEGKLILVSAVAYNTSQEAKLHLKRVSRLSDADAWVLHK